MKTIRMINPKELRIGNFILHNNEITNVEAILSDNVISVDPIELENINAVPFELALFQTSLNFMLDGTRLLFGIFSLQYDLGRNRMVLFAEQNIETGVEVTSLHELQNLYFALTGNELEINIL